MTQLIPTELEDGTIIYFQVEESAATPFTPTRSFPIDANAQIAAKERAIQSFQAMQNLVRGYTINTLNAFRNLGSAEVSEVTLEFGVSLDAKAGVPFIASGGASSNLKITVKCAFPKKSGE
jgi:Trypsin-co-occurring domain 1